MFSPSIKFGYCFHIPNLQLPISGCQSDTKIIANSVAIISFDRVLKDELEKGRTGEYGFSTLRFDKSAILISISHY